MALFCAHRVLATELITNGNFSSFSGGLPTSWSYTQGDGPATLQNAANSPFTNVYPTGTSDLLFTDTAASGVEPNIIQSFASQTGTIYVSWDFNLSSLTGNPWVVQIDNSVAAALRFNIDYTGGTFALEQSGGMFTAVGGALTPGTWYQVAIAVDIAAQTFSGTLTPQAGVAIPFNGLFRQPAASINRFVFIDISPPGGNGSGTNSDIQLDNVSVNTTAPVPEPSTMAFALLGVAGLAVVQRFRRAR